MKKNKSNLDEMQEMKLLKIEHNGCWLAFWGLVAAIVIQTVMDSGDFRSIAGECFVLIPLSLYISIACIRNGIWDRKLKPNASTNLLVSAVAGGVVGLMWFVTSYRNYHKLAGSVATFVFMFIFVFIPCFAILTVTTGFYKKRKNQMEKQAELDENEE